MHLHDFYQKKEHTHLRLLLILLTIIFFFAGCDKAPNDIPSQALSTEERVWMEKFFKDVMLDESAIYTLFGSKPMTAITLSYRSDEEVNAFFDQMSEEEKATAVVVNDYDLPQNWEKWGKIRSRFPMTRYLFFKKADPEDSKFATLYFVDILRVALILQEYHDIFKSETGIDFHPLQVVFEMEKGSPFWDQVFDNSVLVGLLYGFGLKNSYSFTWKYGELPETCTGFCQALLSRSSDEPTYGNATISHFRLPIFASFSEQDEVIEKYEKERGEIKQRYRGKDFLSLTLLKLTSHVSGK